MLHTATRPNILTSLNVRGTALDRALPAFVQGRNKSGAAAVRLRRLSLAANSRKQRQGTAATLRTILSIVLRMEISAGLSGGLSGEIPIAFASRPAKPYTRPRAHPWAFCREYAFLAICVSRQWRSPNLAAKRRFCAVRHIPHRRGRGN